MTALACCMWQYKQLISTHVYAGPKRKKAKSSAGTASAGEDNDDPGEGTHAAQLVKTSGITVVMCLLMYEGIGCLFGPVDNVRSLMRDGQWHGLVHFC